MNTALTWQPKASLFAYELLQKINVRHCALLMTDERYKISSFACTSATAETLALWDSILSSVRRNLTVDRKQSLRGFTDGGMILAIMFMGGFFF
jgi:hypothetical protein